MTWSCTCSHHCFPPICSKPIWPPVLPAMAVLTRHPEAQARSSSGSCQLLLFLEAFIVPVSSPQGLSAATDSSPWSPDSITTALLSTPADSLCLQPCIFWICLHHKCEHAISCLSPSRSSPYLQGHVQSVPQVIGTVIQLLLITPLAAH